LGEGTVWVVISVKLKQLIDEFPKIVGETMMEKKNFVKEKIMTIYESY